MGKLRARIFDRNRYSKRYPFIRGPKRYSYMGDADLSIELGTLTFTGEKEKKFVFEGETPVAKKLQKNLMQFTTNQQNLHEIEIQVNALRETISDLGY